MNPGAGTGFRAWNPPLRDAPDLMTPANYTRSEERALSGALASSGAVRCPRCDVRMDRRELPPLAGFAYVRRRVWLTCPGCRRSVVLDVRLPPDDPDPDRS